MFEPVLELPEIMDYVGDFQRPFKEGTAILKSRHLMECGLIKSDQHHIHVMALCLKTSQLDGKPHQIDVIINSHPCKRSRTVIGTCTCKAGSGKCKHVVAVMMFLNRQPIEALEDLSCTDIQQQWGQIRDKAREMYEPVPVEQFCCVEKGKLPFDGRHQPRVKTPGLKAAVFNILMEGFADSALAIELSQTRETLRDLPMDVDTNYTEESEDIPALATDLVISSNALVVDSSELDNQLLNSCSPDEQLYYHEHVAVTAGTAVDICLSTVDQVGNDWLNHRKPRITGSRCYNIYTYNRQGRNGADRNWEKKLDNIVFPKFKGNADTTFGKVNEPLAISAYERQTNTCVTKLGIIINHHAPWLGYSPDGVVADLVLGRLIEVKCLRVGRTHSGIGLARESKCLIVEGEQISLKKKHSYYGQVQLGMLVTNLPVCDFILYSAANDSCVIVPVLFDPIFVRDMLMYIRDAYFLQMLPYLTNVDKDSRMI